MQCKEGGKCIKCGGEFDFALEDDGTIKCLNKSHLALGYFKNTTTNVYEKCMANCLYCSDKTSCEGCQNNYMYKEKTCEYNPEKQFLNAFLTMININALNVIQPMDSNKLIEINA